MSRIGNNPITIPAGVELKVDEGVVTAKGPKGELSQKVDLVDVKIEEGTITLSRNGDTKEEKAKTFNLSLYPAKLRR